MALPIIFNAKAGALKVGHQVSARHLEQASDAAGLEINLIATHSPAEMQAAVHRLVAGGAPRLGTAGGDATVALAVQELACSRTALGILPTGTANNFASALGLPGELSTALRILKEGCETAVDLGKVGERYSTESAGVGVLADALRFYGLKTNKNLFRAAYTFVGVLRSYHSSRLTLYLDGTLHSERAVLCEVTNTYRTGSALPLAPGAKLDDGQLEVVVWGDLSLKELWVTYRALRTGRYHDMPKISRFSAKEVRIEVSSRPMNVHLDAGALLTTPVTVSVAERALHVLRARAD